MVTTGADRFQALLSQRAAKGPRPPMGVGPHIKYRFGAGNPDPSSFPYDGLVQATADVMEVEGADALSYGNVFGHQELREWVCHYNRGRPHASLGPGIPDRPLSESIASSPDHRLPAGYRVTAASILGSLHHEYRLAREAA